MGGTSRSRADSSGSAGGRRDPVGSGCEVLATLVRDRQTGQNVAVRRALISDPQKRHFGKVSKRLQIKNQFKYVGPTFLSFATLNIFGGFSWDIG